MNGFRLVLIIGIWFSLMNGLNLSYGAGDVTTAGRLAITSSAAEASSGSKLFLNAKDYGVVGDGVTDDMPAIDALLADVILANGGHVHFPAGTYLLKSIIDRPKNVVYDNITISGDGPATIFKGRDQDGGIPNNRGSERWHIFDIKFNHHLRIQDMAFEGYLTFLRARHADDITISNIHGEGHIANAGNHLMQFGAFFADNEGVRVTECTFKNFNDAIYFSAFLNEETDPFDPLPEPLAVRRAIVTNNHFENNVAAGGFSALFPVGVYVFYAHDTIIANNTFLNIYSSFDNGTFSSGMGYAIYDGDGVSTGLTIANNSIVFTGNGNKNATGILTGSDSNTIIRGNNLRSSAGRMIYGIRAFRSTTSTTSEPVANRLIAHNVIHMADGEVLTSNYGIWVSSSPLALSNIDISGNLITGPWATGIRMESEQYARVQIVNNLLIGGTLRQLYLIGTGIAAGQGVRIAGNRFMNGQTQAISAVTVVGTIIENNTILDGNLSGLTGNFGSAIELQSSAFGFVIRNNTIGNTPAGGGLYTNASSMSSASSIFKRIVYNNNLMGFNVGSAAWVNFPTASPTTGFYDADFGDTIYNSALAAGGIPGWVCTKASRTTLTANASSASTTVTVASTTGYATGDLVMLTKVADMYATDFDDVNQWHATTIASVTNSTQFVLTTAIPAGDGTYASGTAQLKRAVFKPLPAIGS